MVTLTEMISAGDKVLIQFSTFEERLLSVVIDVGEEGGLMVYAPLLPKIVQRLQSDSRVEVRFAYEGSLLGFHTRVGNPVENVMTVLELDPPRECYDAEERCEPRCPCCFPATVHFDDKMITAVVEDMSVVSTRIRLLTDSVLSLANVGSTVRLVFQPFDEGVVYSIKCVVLNVFVKDGSQYGVLEFGSEQDDARQRIEQFVEGQLACGVSRL